MLWIFAVRLALHRQQRGHQSKPFVFSHISGPASSLSFWVIWLFGRFDPLLALRLRGPPWVSSQICLVWPLEKKSYTHNAPTCPSENTHTQASGEAVGEASWLRQHLDPDSWSDEVWCGLGASETLHSQWTCSTTCSVSYSTEVRQTIRPQKPRQYIRWILKEAFLFVALLYSVLWSCVL